MMSTRPTSLQTCLQKKCTFLEIVKLWTFIIRKRLLSGRVPDNNLLLSGTPLKWCWLAMPLGAGVPDNNFILIINCILRTYKFDT